MGIFETSESVRAKAAARLGFDRPSTLDMVNRGSYADDDTFLDACTKLELERSSPEYREIRGRLSAELQQRREAEQRQRQEAAFKQTRQSVKLDAVELHDIDREARRLAERDLADKRIFSYQLGEAISKHAEALTERAKDDKAARLSFNAALRSALHGNQM